jgi:transcriptional regulator with XRE-family HTH domain
MTAMNASDAKTKTGGAHQPPKVKPGVQEEGYGIDGSTPLRALRTALDAAAGAPVSISSLAIRYDHGLDGDLSRVKLNELRDRSAHDHEAKLWLLRDAASTLAKWLDIQEVDGDTLVTMKPGFTPDDLRWGLKVVVPHESVNEDEVEFLRSFDPTKASGIFATDWRDKATGKRDEACREDLRWSMQTFGWLEGHEAILDENGVVLVGNRRLAMARELGIPERTITLTFGTGVDATKRRWHYMMGSNMGPKPFTSSDRKKMAWRLRKEEGWSQERIAEFLRCDQKTVSNDLREQDLRREQDLCSLGNFLNCTKGERLHKSGLTKEQRFEKAKAAVRVLLARGVRPNRDNVNEIAKVGEKISQDAVNLWRESQGEGEPEQPRPRSKPNLVLVPKQEPEPEPAPEPEPEPAPEPEPELTRAGDPLQEALLSLLEQMRDEVSRLPVPMTTEAAREVILRYDLPGLVDSFEVGKVS